MHFIRMSIWYLTHKHDKWLTVGLLIGKTACGVSYIWVQISTEIWKTKSWRCRPRTRCLRLPVVCRYGQWQLACQSRYGVSLPVSSKARLLTDSRRCYRVSVMLLSVRLSIHLPYCFMYCISKLRPQCLCISLYSRYSKKQAIAGYAQALTDMN